MIIDNDIHPAGDELPSNFADRLGLHYTKQVTVNHKKGNGQFFTPPEIASLMASMSQNQETNVRILDAGCGTVILTSALCEHLVNSNPNLRTIEVVAYEFDADIISHAEKSLIYLKEWLLNLGIDFHFSLLCEDFILMNADSLRHDESTLEVFNYTRTPHFDIVISNPPYFKLSKEDKRAKVSKELVSGQPNIYSIFMGIASNLLREHGELIFITPRSFASGNYFKAFREYFFNRIRIDRIHLFSSRRDAFNRDAVLQETVIMKGVKQKFLNTHEIIVTSSVGLKDIKQPAIKRFTASVLIDLNSKEKILHLPINDKEESIFTLVSGWKNRLIDYQIQISTGPVVAFRAWDYIRSEPDNENTQLVPLYWLHNVNKMILQHPTEAKNKGQYIKVEDGSMSLLIANKNYILLRRFSTKDDKSRLIAAPYFCNSITANFIGVENKVNYIYRIKSHLERNEVVGLCALLNSELFDTYFQIFNGNVNVSATELREMKFPTLETIREIGNNIILANDYSMSNINKTINGFFDLTAIFDRHE